MEPAFEFPRGFLWGAATSAYQVEGSPLADGAGPGIWHRFTHTPGLIADGATGDVACDHYRRYRDDVALMRTLGLRAYRFSIAWTRVLPDGHGRVNPRGLDFYERLVDALLEHGIEPIATLYHWDLPAALDDRGGWLNPDSAHWFADYARLVYRRLDGRVRKWLTVNEPAVAIDGGYLRGTLAPGHRNRYEAPRAAHHLLLAHGAAVQAYRAEGRHAIGIALNLEPQYPASADAADHAAARRADAWINRLGLDPVLLGRYPDELRALFGDAWPQWPDDDLARIRQPLDFVGCNYYTRRVVRDDATAWPLQAGPVAPRAPCTDLGWEVYPRGLVEVLGWLRDRYGNPPVYVTENGAAFHEPSVVHDETLEDAPRMAYLRAHLRALHDAIGQGCDVRGYLAWALLDNFEWAFGYAPRFGLVHVDYATQRRTPKASARLYARIIAANGGALAE